MSRRTYSCLLLLVLSLSVAATAAQQTVKIQVITTRSETINLTGDSGSTSMLSIPCAQPVPADSTPPPHDPGSAVPVCSYASSGVASYPARFSQSNAILITEDGRTYGVVLYCQRQLSNCPKLVEGKSYTGRMDKKTILDNSKPVFGPPKVALRPDGRRKVWYTIFSPRRLVIPASKP